ncbi:Pimeloyl-ACP methyl ester carboxylesterase [Asanoa hainanensis]|uniref:Pimeloyl-ACP methyl ester carboxylesterase n=1 Tax=Asanoa hainanensis TaxID=560556 RepID=A0A239N287_9ACTN|nr:alpha/beta hydrolase [Asanoa hainanensis]SNT48870.1 Pimeloyl-ACP methyl ester carboxylesterase [Asanoa hainanensis]
MLGISLRRPKIIAATFAAAMLLTAVGSATPNALADGGLRPPSDDQGTKPTIVLVHGAWADGSSWSQEVANLQARGYEVQVAPQPNRGPSVDVGYLKDFLSTIEGPIVLAAHSYGGFVASNAATGNPNVKALVFVDAFAPDQGETLAALTAGSGSILEPALTDPTSVFKLVPFPGAPQGAVDSYVLPEVFITGFANDLPRAQGAVLAVSQSALATNALMEPSGEPAWKTIPSWAVIGTEDLVIPPAGQEMMMKRAGATITRIDAGHLGLISHPDDVTAVIIEAARSI